MIGQYADNNATRSGRLGVFGSVFFFISSVTDGTYTQWCQQTIVHTRGGAETNMNTRIRIVRKQIVCIRYTHTGVYVTPSF